MRDFCCLLLCLILNAEYGALQTGNVVYATFGILKDNRVSSAFVKEALNQVLQEIQSPSLISFNEVDSANASDVLQKVCSMMTSSPSFLLYVAGCNDDQGLRYIADALNLPILRVESASGTKCPETSRCMRQRGSDTKYFIKIPAMSPRMSKKTSGVTRTTRAVKESYKTSGRLSENLKKETKLFWNVPNQISVGMYFASLQWSRLIFLYDYSYDFSTLQNVMEYLGDRMKFAIVQKLPINRMNGQLVLQSSKTLIRNVVTEAACPNPECEDKIVFAFLCGERTAKNIIAELLPFFRVKNIRIYIVDIGWTKSFVKNVLFSKELTIITRQEKRVSQQLLPYDDDLKYLKTQLKSTLVAASKVLENSKFQQYYSMDSNTTCGNELLNRSSHSDYFVSSIKSAFGIDSKMNGTNGKDYRMTKDTGGTTETYLDSEVQQYQKRYIMNDNDKAEELKLCRLSGGRQVKCTSIAEETKVNERDRTSPPIPVTDTYANDKIKNNEEIKEPKIATNLDLNVTLENLTLRVVTVEDPPFVFVKRDRGTVEFYGFSIDLLKVLSTRLGFRYELYEVEDRKYGSYTNESWNGVMADLIYKKADMAISAMTITLKKQDFIDFTVPYMDYTAGILTVKTRSNPYSSLFGFARPFDSSVWYCIVCGWFIVSVLLFILNNIYKPRSQSFRETCWTVFSSMTQQGSDTHLLSLPSQIVTGFWYFFVFVVIAFYIASLAANFAVLRTDKEIQSFSDLAHQTDIEYGTVRDTNIYDEIKTGGQQYTDGRSDSFIWRSIWSVVSNKENSVSVAKNGVRRVKESGGIYAFIWDSAVIDFLVGTDPSCTLTSIKDSAFQKGYGIGLQRGSFIKDILSVTILEIEKEGIVQEMESQLRQKYSCMPSATNSEFSAIDLDQFAGLFGILGAGLITGCIAAMCEVCIRARRTKLTKCLFDGKITAKITQPEVYIERSGHEKIRIIISGIKKNKILEDISGESLLTVSNTSNTNEKNGTINQT